MKSLWLVLLLTLLPARGATGFDGLTSFAAGTYAGPSGNTSFTVSCWLNFSSVASRSFPLYIGGVVNAQRLAINACDGDTKIRPYWGGNGTASTTNVTTGVWYHVLIAYSSGGALWLYINGVQESTSIIGLTIPSNTNFSYGASFTGGLPFAGSIAEVAVYDSDITNAGNATPEVAALFHKICPLLVKPSSLKFYAPLIGGRTQAYKGLPMSNTAPITSTPHFAVFKQ